MKRIFFSLFALMCMFAFTGNAQAKLGKSEIPNLIKDNWYLNYQNGVTNPDMIQPGQKLDYKFADGFIYNYTAVPGDSQWKILDKKLSELRLEHGDVTGISEAKTDTTETSKPAEAASIFTLQTLPGWMINLLALMAFATIIILALILKKVSSRTNRSPIVQGGISEAQAPMHMQRVAERMGRGARLVGPVVKGWLTANVPVEVSYLEGPRMETFHRKLAYRGLVEFADGTRSYAYFQQICGNDINTGPIVREGEGITFEPEVVQSEVLQSANQQFRQAANRRQEQNSTLLDAKQTDEPVSKNVANSTLAEVAKLISENRDKGFETKITYATRDVIIDVDTFKAKQYQNKPILNGRSAHPVEAITAPKATDLDRPRDQTVATQDA